MRVLLLGGTSETAPLAQAILAAGLDVVVSTATDAPLPLPTGVTRRAGRLDAAGIAAFANHIQASCLLDAGHPFAAILHEMCLSAAQQAGLPCLRYFRPSHAMSTQAHTVPSHAAAAQLAFQLGSPVLLTTGSRFLDCYLQEARRTGQALFARVLNHPESQVACEAAGLAPSEIIIQRGPFSLEDNLTLIEATQAKVLVTKDSGEAGGLDYKVEAARQKGIPVVIVARPQGSEAPSSTDLHSPYLATFTTAEALREYLLTQQESGWLKK